MHCKCGYPLKGREKFCPECGEKASAPPLPDSQTVPCPNTVQEGKRTQPCGNVIDSTKTFCTECGWHIDYKAFKPGAAMCNGIKPNGEPCDNIVTPNIKFCSECGKPPDRGPPSAAGKDNVELF